MLRLGYWPTSIGRVVVATVCVALGHGCSAILLNPNYCANQGGDAFCREHGGGFCVHGTGACIEQWSGDQASNPDFNGCVEQVPTDMGCYSPCGGGQPATADEDCVGGTTGEETAESSSGDEPVTLDGSDGSTSTSDTTGQPSECGNDVLDQGEVCDGESVTFDCVSMGYAGGTLACEDDCSAYDTSGCTNCGNDMVEPGESCDGLDLAGQTCISLGYGGGTLACDPVMCAFDTSMCTMDACGNDMVDNGEDCDGVDLAGEDCGSQGYERGTLMCNAMCEFDISECSICGDGILQGDEDCDGIDFGGQSCISLGFGGGTLACHLASCLLDVSGCDGS